MFKVLLISVSARRGKRSHFGKLPFQRTFNFGLLSVATVAAQEGFGLSVWDTADERFDPETGLGAALERSHAAVVGLSCISGFSYPDFLEVAALVRSALPTCVIVAGGMDHVGRMPEVVLDEAPAVDAVISGYGEQPFLRLLQALSSAAPISGLPGVTVRGHGRRASPLTLHRPGSAGIPAAGGSRAEPPEPDGLPSLNYGLYEGLPEFPASAEVARGCPYSCEFCVSAGGKVVRRTPEELADEMLSVAMAYGDPQVRLYLEAPLASFSRDYLKKLKSELAARGIAPTWRTESRVDTLRPDTADELAQAGCRVVDLGLESAAPRILEIMKKTRNPQDYLQRASRLLQAFAAAGIFSKVNVLFYAGERRSTLAQTRDYLDRHRGSIGAIAAGPLYLYPGIHGSDHLLEVVRDHGGGLVGDPAWAARHLQPVNPSAELSFDALSAMALEWERDFQSAYGYWHSRRWGYFSPGIGYEQFSAAVRAAGVQHFPFPPDTLENTKRDVHRWLP